MSGYRMCTGFGVLPSSGTYTRGSIDALPKNGGVQMKPSDCIPLLTNRFGAGLTLSLSRNRNNNYHQDIGLREFTVATSGMYEGDFSISGVFVPGYSEWLQYVFNTDPITITSASVLGNMVGGTWTPVDGVPAVDAIAQVGTDAFYKWDGKKWVSVASGPATYTPTTFATFKSLVAYMDTITGYVKNGDVIGTEPIGFGTFSRYKPTEATETRVIYSYSLFNGPKTFDMGFVQMNNKTASGGLNEVGVLCGCAIESVSINYDSGSEVAVQFSIEGHFLLDYLEPTSTDINYNAYLEDVPKRALVAGCMSTSDDGSDYTAIAQTESAGITISNSLYKLGNCLKLNYSSYSVGALTYTVETTTYSNNPNKYLKTLYGYDNLQAGTVYTVAKQPIDVPFMKIRSDNTSAILTEATEFLDVNMENVYVGSINRSYDVDNALMDSPDLRSRHINIVVGYINS